MSLMTIINNELSNISITEAAFLLLTEILEVDSHLQTITAAMPNYQAQLLTIAFYPRDAMLARVFAIATCPSVRPPHAGIVPSRAKAGS